MFTHHSMILIFKVLGEGKKKVDVFWDRWALISLYTALWRTHPKCCYLLEPCTFRRAEFKPGHTMPNGEETQTLHYSRKPRDLGGMVLGKERLSRQGISSEDYYQVVEIQAGKD